MPPFDRILGFQILMDKKDSKRSDSPASFRSISDGSDFSRETTVSSHSSLALYRKPSLLPSNYEPRSIDVLCARGRSSTKHNAWYTDLIRVHAPAYLDSNAYEKNAIVTKILAACRNRGGFIVKKNRKHDRWEDIGDKEARKKIAHGIRDRLKQIGTPIKGGDSSSKQQSESEGSSDTDSHKVSSCEKKIETKKRRAKKGDKDESKKKSSRPPKPPPAILQENSEASREFHDNNDDNGKVAMMNGQNNNSDVEERPSVLSPNMNGSMNNNESNGMCLGNKSHNAGFVDPRMHMKLEYPQNMPASYPQSLQWQQHMMMMHHQHQQQLPFFPQQHWTSSNPNITFDSSNTANPSMMRGRQPSMMMPAVNSVNNQNNLLTLAPSMDVKSHPSNQQPSQNLMHPSQMDTMNLFSSSLNPSLSNASMLDPVSGAGEVAPSKSSLPDTLLATLSGQSTLQRHASSSDLFSRNGDNGIDLSFSHAFDPEMDLDAAVQEDVHKTGNSFDVGIDINEDDLPPFDMLGDGDVPEPPL